MQSLQRFMVTDLSNFYLDITKDRLYVRAADSFDRRACQTVLAALLQVSHLKCICSSVCWGALGCLHNVGQLAEVCHVSFLSRIAYMVLSTRQ